jgi:hypothetical protein
MLSSADVHASVVADMGYLSSLQMVASSSTLLAPNHYLETCNYDFLRDYEFDKGLWHYTLGGGLLMSHSLVTSSLNHVRNPVGLQPCAAALSRFSFATPPCFCLALFSPSPPDFADPSQLSRRTTRVSNRL